VVSGINEYGMVLREGTKQDKKKPPVKEAFT
jgi:hypothetical protein